MPTTRATARQNVIVATARNRWLKEMPGTKAAKKELENERDRTC
jgi:hypothetical protein